VDLTAVEDASDETPEPVPTLEDLHMPRVSYDDARRIMTRADFVEQLDHLHVRPLLISRFLGSRNGADDRSYQ